MDQINITKGQDGWVTITVGGRFDFSTHAKFRAACEHDLIKGARVKVDLRRVDYLDSAALGMLLLLRDQVGGRTEKVVLEVSSKEIVGILKVAAFDQLFEVRPPVKAA